MGKAHFDFDFNTKTTSEIYDFVKYCMDEVYDKNDVKEYNKAAIFVGSMISRTDRVGESYTFIADPPENLKGARLLFVTSKIDDGVRVTFDIDFNVSNEGQRVIDFFRRKFMESSDAVEAGEFDTILNLARQIVETRRNLNYNMGYDDYYEELEAVLACLLYLDRIEKFKKKK